MTDQTDMKAVIDAAVKGATPVNLASTTGVEHWYLPHGKNGVGEVVEINLEKGLNEPIRKRGTVVVFDAASFNQVIADNGDAGDIAIYCDRDPQKPSVVAVLNGHGKNGAGWGDFRAQIEFRRTPQWLKWRGLDGKMMPQAEFAEFIEDNLADIADPPGAKMLEIATYLQATRTVNFKSGVRLPSGQIQFLNMEDISAKVGAGHMAVPETFRLGIAPLFGLAAYQIPARFRYRIEDGKLKLGFKMQRVEDVMGKLIEEVIAKIERGANVSVLDGLPPSA